MSEKNETTDPLELARQAKAAGIEKLRAFRERNAVEDAERATHEAARVAEGSALENEFGAAEAELARLERLAVVDAAVADAATRHQHNVEVDEEAYQAVVTALQELADAVKKAVPAGVGPAAVRRGRTGRSPRSGGRRA